MSYVRVENVALEYQPLISHLPVTGKKMYSNAASNDEVTVNHWRQQWIDNIKANKARYGSFRDHSVHKLYREHEYKPAIVAGSGPSLKYNAKDLKDRKGIPLVSCLHNFHYFEDLDLAPEYYCTLDAGEVTVEEVYEGGSKDPEWYWERTKDRKLIAYIGTHPKLLEKWQGEVYFFNAPLPDVKPDLNLEIEQIEDFRVYISSGGNVLGTCLYFAKAILGCRATVFVGADFSFGYPEISKDEPTHRFHSWASKYDAKMGKTMRVTDVFGNKVHTWPSYYNFKNFFDYVASHIPGEYFNCTEGGCMGAYSEGNLSHFKYMSLKQAFKELCLHYEIEDSFAVGYDKRKILY